MVSVVLQSGIITPVKPPNNRHVGIHSSVLCREVILYRMSAQDQPLNIYLCYSSNLSCYYSYLLLPWVVYTRIIPFYSNEKGEKATKVVTGNEKLILNN